MLWFLTFLWLTLGHLGSLLLFLKKKKKKKGSLLLVGSLSVLVFYHIELFSSQYNLG